jgi:hypothetical protein
VRVCGRHAARGRQSAHARRRRAGLRSPPWPSTTVAGRGRLAGASVVSAR